MKPTTQAGCFRTSTGLGAASHFGQSEPGPCEWNPLETCAEEKSDAGPGADIGFEWRL